MGNKSCCSIKTVETNEVQLCPPDSLANSMISNKNYKQILNFKDFRGFKKVENIKERYAIGSVLGQGSFG